MLQYASVVGLFRTILIIGLIYFGVKILSRLFAPLIMKFFVKKVEQKFGSQFDGFQNKQKTQTKKDGEVTIDKIPNTKNSNKNVGDYIDYEEID